MSSLFDIFELTPVHCVPFLYKYMGAVYTNAIIRSLNEPQPYAQLHDFSSANRYKLCVHIILVVVTFQQFERRFSCYFLSVTEPIYQYDK